MAYCPKCGVEVECDVEKCPLCDFSVPDVGEVCKEEDQRYPQAINTYPEDHLEKKNMVFFSIGIITLSILLILLVVNFVYPWSNYVKLIGLVVVALFAIIYFLLGYLKPWKNFLGIYVSLVVVLFFIYDLTNSQNLWFSHYAFPIISLLYLDVLLFRLVLKYTRKKSEFVFMPTSLISFIIVLALGIDGIISFNLSGSLSLSWSLIVSISGLAIILLLQVIYHRLSEKTLKKIRKKMHV